MNSTRQKILVIALCLGLLTGFTLVQSMEQQVEKKNGSSVVKKGDFGMA